MDETVLFNLTYGLFLVSSKTDSKENGCIVNTISQVASNPTRIALSCIKGNLTQRIISESKMLSCSILDKRAKFDLFERFGLSHGDDVNKFEGYDVKYDLNGMPYIEDYSCGLLSLKVIEEKDLGSHILYICQIVDTKKLSNEAPVTYSQYHSEIKPKKTSETNRKIIGYKCTICGYVLESETLPSDFICPWCGHPASDFEPIYQ